MITVIYYHQVVPNGEGMSYQKIDIDRFRAHMQYLRDNGYTTLYFSELSKPLPEKAVIVSFDDGFASVCQNAAPIMKEYGIKGNVYLPTAYIGEKPQFMTWDMVKALSADFEFQAHTHNHADIRTLTREALSREIQASDQAFENHALPHPTAFCMPFGTFNAKSIKTLKQTGRYRYLLGSYYGRIGKLNSHGTLPRIGISNDDSVDVFADKLNGKYDWKGPLQRLRLSLQNLRHQTVTEYQYD